MKILVTGCAGFIGSHLCEKLCINKYQVLGIDNINDYYDQKQKENNLKILRNYNNFTFKKDDILCTNMISQYKPDVVVHLAAMAGVRYSIENPTLYVKTNVEGQVNLLQQCVINNVQQFVYASSSSVYGMNTKVPFSETDSIDKVNSPYAASKKSCETMAQLYNQLYGIKVTGLRFFTVYGPRGRPDMAPYKFLKAISTGSKFNKYGDGNTYRDYTYIDDITDGIIGAIKNKYNKSCEVYNLGNGNPINLNKFIKICEQITGKKANYNLLDNQIGDVPKTYADISKARQDLDYNPSVTFTDGLTKMYEWMMINIL